MPCKQLLVIEDDPAISQILHDVLEHRGYHVVTAKDGEEGLAHLRAVSDPPCMILLDMMMPRMNGWQFLDVQRTDPKLAGIPVVICSAYHESARAVRPAALVPKPIELKTLLKVVQALCA